VGELHWLGQHELLTRTDLREWISEGLAGGGNTPGSREAMSWNWKSKMRAGLSGASVVLTGVAVYWAALPEPRVVTPGQSSGRLAGRELPRLRAESAPPAATPPRTEPRAAPDSEEATVAQYTAQKYQYLFDDMHSPHVKQARLQRALLLREQLAGQPDTAERAQALAEAEARIRAMLHPADFATYDALKASDLEQFELNDYAGGVSNVAPLNADERKSILRTKLAYKGRFQQLVEDSGLLRSDLSPAERDHAYGVTSRALHDYQTSYLQEVRQYLANDEQYALLRNYETTKFSAELAKLRSMAGGS
jgi:hypothetical protein